MQAKVLVPSSARNSPIFPTIVASLKFLGGMNGAFALLAALVLAKQDIFLDHQQRMIFAFVFAAAHFSQFIYNVPIAMQGGRQGESYWHVLKGPMLFIFVVDGLLTIANFALAIVYVLQ